MYVCIYIQYNSLCMYMYIIYADSTLFIYYYYIHTTPLIHHTLHIIHTIQYTLHTLYRAPRPGDSFRPIWRKNGPVKVVQFLRGQRVPEYLRSKMAVIVLISGGEGGGEGSEQVCILVISMCLCMGEYSLFFVKIMYNTI